MTDTDIDALAYEAEAALHSLQADGTVDRGEIAGVIRRQAAALRTLQEERLSFAEQAAENGAIAVREGHRAESADARAQELWTERRQILQDAGGDQWDLLKRAESAEARVAALEEALGRYQDRLHGFSTIQGFKAVGFNLSKRGGRTFEDDFNAACAALNETDQKGGGDDTPAPKMAKPKQQREDNAPAPADVEAAGPVSQCELCGSTVVGIACKDDEGWILYDARPDCPHRPDPPCDVEPE